MSAVTVAHVLFGDHTTEQPRSGIEHRQQPETVVRQYFGRSGERRGREKCVSRY